MLSRTLLSSCRHQLDPIKWLDPSLHDSFHASHTFIFADIPFYIWGERMGKRVEAAGI